MYGKKEKIVWVVLVVLACVCCGCLGTCIYMYQRHTFRNTHACAQHSGKIVIPILSSTGTDTTLLFQQSGSVGNFAAVQPINPTLLRSSSSSSCRSSSSLAFSFTKALHLPLTQLMYLYSTVVGSCHTQSMTPARSTLLRPCVIIRDILYTVLHMVCI